METDRDGDVGYSVETGARLRYAAAHGVEALLAELAGELARSRAADPPAFLHAYLKKNYPV